MLPPRSRALVSLQVPLRLRWRTFQNLPSASSSPLHPETKTPLSFPTLCPRDTWHQGKAPIPGDLGFKQLPGAFSGWSPEPSSAMSRLSSSASLIGSNVAHSSWSPSSLLSSSKPQALCLKLPRSTLYPGCTSHLLPLCLTRNRYSLGPCTVLSSSQQSSATWHSTAQETSEPDGKEKPGASDQVNAVNGVNAEHPSQSLSSPLEENTENEQPKKEDNITDTLQTRDGTTTEEPSSAPSPPQRDTDVANATSEESSTSAEGRPAGTPRRRRVRRPELLLVPGVGPRTLLKLRNSGIEEVSALTRVYREKRGRRDGGLEGMVEYLRRDVGVRRDHATLISTFIKHTVDKEEGEEDSVNVDKGEGKRESKRLTFCVEGNISVGKSTFLRRVAGELLKLHEFVEIVPEPIDKWQDVGEKHLNLLKEFYQDPKRHAYTFQNYVLVTRVMQSLKTREGKEPLRLMERSIFSDRMVFVRAVHEAEWLDDTELTVYDSSFDPFVRNIPGVIPDGFIYLRADPHTCYERLQKRGREEENTVSFEYLDNLHRKHDSWLIPPDINPLIVPSLRHTEGGVLINGRGERNLRVDEKWPRDVSVPVRLKDKVFGLRGAEVHPCIQNVPALVLDCNRHIDFNISPDEIHWYADDILAFFNFVKSMKEGEALDKKQGNSNLISPEQCVSQYQNMMNSMHAAL